MDKFLNPIERVNFKQLFVKDIDKKFKDLVKIGQGRYGKVYRARSTDGNKVVALKKITPFRENEGFDPIFFREISILQNYKHSNIVNLEDIVVSYNEINNGVKQHKRHIFLVFEYIEHDICGILKKNISFEEGEIKRIMKQILEAFKYLHSNNVIHRDFKSENVLITTMGDVKIADFGLAKVSSYDDSLKNYRNTNRQNIVTLWYRAPELILGESLYSTEIDIWSVGCFMYELYSNKIPLFEGKSEYEVLKKIFEVCGDPASNKWHNATALVNSKMKNPTTQSLPNFASLLETSYKNNLFETLKAKCPKISNGAMALISRMINLDPKQRITAEEALEHQYFKEGPIAYKVFLKEKIKEPCHKFDASKNEESNRNKWNRFIKDSNTYSDIGDSLIPQRTRPEIIKLEVEKEPERKNKPLLDSTSALSLFKNLNDKKGRDEKNLVCQPTKKLRPND